HLRRHRGHHSAEARRGHAYYGIGDAVEAERPADDGRVAAEARLPESIADDRDWRRTSRGKFLAYERAAENGSDAERLEVVVGDDLAGDDVRAAVDGEQREEVGVPGEGGKRLRVRTVLLVVGIRV